MTKVYIMVGVISVVVVVAIIYGFTVIGSPFARQAVKMDQTRLSNFTTIHSAVQSYAITNYKLPEKLSDLPQNSYTVTTDPQTKKSYDYMTVSDTSYKLCATFSADSSANKNDYGYYDYTTNSSKIPTYKKGYDCISYEVSASYINKPITTPLTLDYDSHYQYSLKVVPGLKQIDSVPNIFTNITSSTSLKQGTVNPISYTYSFYNAPVFLIDSKNNYIGFTGITTICDPKTKICTFQWTGQTIYADSYELSNINPGQYYFVVTKVDDFTQIIGKSSVFTLTK